MEKVTLHDAIRHGEETVARMRAMGNVDSEPGLIANILQACKKGILKPIEAIAKITGIESSRIDR